MKKLLLIALLTFSFNANSALIGRLAATPGGTDYQAYYDDVTDLTWLQDANYAQTSGYTGTGVLFSGQMTWQAANDWAAQLTVGGVNGWRLPDTIDVGNNGPTYTSLYQGVDYGYNITTQSELSNMFYNVLSNTAAFDTSGNITSCYFSCLTNTGPFSNLKSGIYWSATESGLNATDAWYFYMALGEQNITSKATTSYIWAVQSGDVGLATSAVPVPAAVWLFGSGLLGLVGVTRRKSATPSLS